MEQSNAVDIAVLKASIEHLERYVHEAEARCKERDQKALDEIAGLKSQNEALIEQVTTLEKKLTASAIVWATICATIATIIGSFVYMIDKALEWKNAIGGALGK